MKPITAILLVFPAILFSQNEKTRATLFPSGRLFSELTYDPTESQAYGTIAVYREKSERDNLTYLPFGLGFYKGFLRWEREKPFEVGFDFSAHSQFEWTTVGGQSQRNLLHTDFKVSVMLNKKISGRHAFRLRFFHVSSHLGDDYILRNQINSYFPNPNNYEQLDFTWAVSLPQNLRLYAGMGLVVRPDTIRKRFSGQAGLQLERPLPTRLPFGLTGGLDVKIFEENDFNPGLKAAFGLRYGEVGFKPVRLVAEFYKGNLPYGPFESKQVMWLGVGIYFLP